MELHVTTNVTWQMAKKTKRMEAANLTMESLALQTGAKFEPLRVFCIQHYGKSKKEKRMASNKHTPLFLLFKRKIKNCKNTHTVRPCLVYNTGKKKERRKWILKCFSRARLRGSSSSTLRTCVELSARPFVSCWVSFSLNSSHLPIIAVWRWNPADRTILSL